MVEFRITCLYPTLSDILPIWAYKQHHRIYTALVDTQFFSSFKLLFNVKSKGLLIFFCANYNYFSNVVKKAKQYVLLCITLCM
ncbi:hypothetical protein ES705_44245 [subsurface metagenome]